MGTKKVINGIISFIFIILIGGIVYTYIEGWSFLDAIYFSAVTITTLGYGDFVPITKAGKLFTIVFSVTGIAIGLYILTMVGKSIFAIELKKLGGRKIVNLKKGKKFNVSKIIIGDNVNWHLNKKDILNGTIIGIELDRIKVHFDKKNDQPIPNKEQKTMVISSNGKVRKTN